MLDITRPARLRWVLGGFPRPGIHNSMLRRIAIVAAILIIAYLALIIYTNSRPARVNASRLAVTNGPPRPNQ